MHEKLTAQDLEDTAFATDVFKNDRAPTYRGLSTRVCPVCGKEFIPAGQHMYRTNIRGKSSMQCSYTCWRAILADANIRSQVNRVNKG